MALNQPYSDPEFIIEDVLIELEVKLKKEGFEVDTSDFVYEIFSRCEYLRIPSAKLYPNEDLPTKFGVYRNYSGGGMHGSLEKTQIDRISKHRKNKAERILKLFEEAFWSILKRTDELNEEVSGEQLQAWDSLTI